MNFTQTPGGARMAGIKLVIDMEPEKSLKLAWRVAQDMAFELTPIKDLAFQASKGHFLWSMLAGAAAPHCKFNFSAHRYDDGTTDVMLERNGALTSGLLGLRRIKTEADALMQKLAEAIQQNGGKVIERKEI
jgi:hypothetical protein